MNRETLPPEYSWPRWQWRVAFWVDTVQLVLSFLGALAIGLTEDGLNWLKQNVILIIAVLLLLYLLVPTLIWLASVVRVGYRRAHNFPQLYRSAERAAVELEQVKRNSVDLLLSASAAREFVILRAAIVKGRLHIVLKKQGNTKLPPGSAIAVVDTADLLLMGWFEVIEPGAGGFHAIEVSGTIDPVWLGDVKQKGESTVLPGMIAIHIPQRDAP